MSIPNELNLKIYIGLAKTLNTIPNGFSPTDDGTHLKLLQWIFEPVEAFIASKLKLTGVTLKRLSRKVKIPPSQLLPILSTMREKGQIDFIRTKKGIKYGLWPFAVGFYEDQLHRMNAELATLVENYFQKTKGDILLNSDPPLHRVIPVKRFINTELEIYPYNEAEKLVNSAKSWGIRDCICRLQQRLIGHTCEYPLSVCLSFSSRENAYENDNCMKVISREEALKVLYEAEEAGLIHTSMNIANGQSYICNCCTCCCGILRGISEFHHPNAIVKSDYRLSIDTELCNGCSKCVNRCQFDALSIIDKKCYVNDRCVGCGTCAITCSKNALKLIPREKNDIQKPPKNIAWWMIKRAIKRKVNLLRII
ncbi:MAG: DUF362 domain-containing protein [Candidatus Thorarchaeota archaeon]